MKEGEILTPAHAMIKGEHKEISAFVLQLDNGLRKAKEKHTELLPDDTALDRHLTSLFREGLKPLIKDKASHKKDECKTFAALISAAPHGEREVSLSPIPIHVKSLQLTAEEEKSPKWASKFCAAKTRKVHSAFASKPTPLLLCVAK